MTDILNVLRSGATVFYEYTADGGALLRGAADEIERLREVERLAVEYVRASETQNRYDGTVNAAYNALATAIRERAGTHASAHRAGVESQSKEE